MWGKLSRDLCKLCTGTKFLFQRRMLSSLQYRLQWHDSLVAAALLVIKLYNLTFLFDLMSPDGIPHLNMTTLSSSFITHFSIFSLPSSLHNHAHIYDIDLTSLFHISLPQGSSTTFQRMNWISMTLSTKRNLQKRREEVSIPKCTVDKTRTLVSWVSRLEAYNGRKSCPITLHVELYGPFPIAFLSCSVSHCLIFQTTLCVFRLEISVAKMREKKISWKSIAFLPSPFPVVIFPVIRGPWRDFPYKQTDWLSFHCLSLTMYSSFSRLLSKISWTLRPFLVFGLASHVDSLPFLFLLWSHFLIIFSIVIPPSKMDISWLYLTGTQMCRRHLHFMNTNAFSPSIISLHGSSYNVLSDYIDATMVLSGKSSFLLLTPNTQWNIQDQGESPSCLPRGQTLIDSIPSQGQDRPTLRQKSNTRNIYTDQEKTIEE